MYKHSIFYVVICLAFSACAHSSISVKDKKSLFELGAEIGKKHEEVINKLFQEKNIGYKVEITSKLIEGNPVYTRGLEYSIYINSMKYSSKEYNSIGLYGNASLYLIEIIVQLLNELEKQKDYEVGIYLGEFFGHLDGLNSQKLIGYYRGEYGPIRSLYFIKNDVKYAFLDSGDAITTELNAFLRAYSLYSEINSRLRKGALNSVFFKDIAIRIVDRSSETESSKRKLCSVVISLLKEEKST